MNNTNVIITTVELSRHKIKGLQTVSLPRVPVKGDWVTYRGKPYKVVAVIFAINNLDNCHTVVVRLKN